MDSRSLEDMISRLAGLITAVLVFVVMKLTGVVSWSWLWVLAPLWLPVAVVLGAALIFGAGNFVIWVLGRDD
jgi:ABC-type polysaccharide/polyol phosphate export permease